MATFFGITGALTAVGPLAGGFLTEWTWRSIFWVNLPVAVIALVLTAQAKLPDERHPAPIDWPGTALVASGMGISVLGLQQSSAWGWDSPVTWICIVAGLLLLVAFVRHELRTEHPVIQMRIFRNRAFSADTAVLFLLMIVFLPLFFFVSLYAQIALGDDASGAGLYLLVFFGGFAAGSQWGGRIVDARGPRATVIPGCFLAAVGLFLWGNSLTKLDLGDQWIYIIVAGIGVGLILGPASTDAVNRAPQTSYGEVTGINQTVRNFGASLGLAVLGTILILRNKANIEASLGALGVPRERADQIADALSQSGGGSASGSFGEATGRAARRAFEAVQHDFALSTRTVFYVMAGVMAATYVVALVWMPRGKAPDPEAAAAPAGAGAVGSVRGSRR
jgi:predicted MFS family arabinose efflux permease